MSTDLDERVRAVKRRIEQAQAEHAQAKAQALVALDRVRQAERALLEEFGVTPGEVPALIASAESDLAAEVKRVELLLEKAEASE